MNTLKIITILISAAFLSAPASLYAGNTNAGKLVLAGGKTVSANTQKPAGGEGKTQSCRETRKKWDECTEGWGCVKVCPQKEDELKDCIIKTGDCP